MPDVWIKDDEEELGPLFSHQEPHRRLKRDGDGGVTQTSVSETSENQNGSKKVHTH